MARGSIKKRGTQWYAIYELGRQWDDEKQGLVRKQRWERPGANTRQAAQQLLTLRLREVDTGQAVAVQLTVAEFVQLWQESRADLKIGTQKIDRQYCRYLVERLGALPLTGVRPDHIVQLRTEWIERYKPGTVGLYLDGVRKVLGAAVEWGYLHSNPASKIPKPRVESGPVAVFTPDELAHLFQAAGPDWRPFYLFAVTTGLRKGELQAARWAELDEAEGTYTVRHSLNRQGEMTTPKSGQVQPVDVSGATMAALKEWRGRQAAHILKDPRYIDQGYIWASKYGNALRPTYLNTVWRRIQKAAGLEYRKFHTLRHTCASLLIAQGADAKYVQTQLRHGSVKITFDTYGHLFPRTRTEQMARLDESIGV